MSDVLTDADRAAIAATLKAIAPGYERIVDVREVLYLAGKRSGQAQLAAAYQQIAALKADAGAMEVLRELYGYIERGELVRDISRDNANDWSIRMAKFALTLNKASALLGSEKD